MSVVKLVLAYDGTDFHGWARQRGARTVQGAVEDVLSRLMPEPPRIHVAGRTDAGVHATGQVASFDAPEGLKVERVQRALNGVLAPEVVCRSAVRAPLGFDARRSASSREYIYRIDTSAIPSPFDARFVWHRPGRLGLRDMRLAARGLVGEHDFASFCRAPKPPSSTVRRLRLLSIRGLGERLEVRAVADSFLHQMVRSLVGTLAAVGEGAMDPHCMPELLAARDRGAAGRVAPARGLTLERVRYGRIDERSP